MHVIPHEMLQEANRRATAEKTVRKIEVEAIAFVVAQACSIGPHQWGDYT